MKWIFNEDASDWVLSNDAYNILGSVKVVFDSKIDSVKYQTTIVDANGFYGKGETLKDPYDAIDYVELKARDFLKRTATEAENKERERQYIMAAQDRIAKILKSRLRLKSEPQHYSFY